MVRYLKSGGSTFLLTGFDQTALLIISQFGLFSSLAGLGANKMNLLFDKICAYGILQKYVRLRAYMPR